MYMLLANASIVNDLGTPTITIQVNYIIQIKYIQLKKKQYCSILKIQKVLSNEHQ